MNKTNKHGAVARRRARPGRYTRYEILCTAKYLHEEITFVCIPTRTHGDAVLTWDLSGIFPHRGTPDETGRPRG